MKKTLQMLLDDSNDIGRKVNYVLQGFILLSLVAFTLETLPNLSDTFKKVLYIIELITIIIFTIEYIARIIASDKKWEYITGKWGIIDLLAIMPYYLSTTIDLRFVRAFRMLRLLRLFKLARSSNALERLSLAFQLAKIELFLFLNIAVIILYLSAVGIYYCEHGAQPEQFQSILHSFWWAIVTLTTLGYGDVYPITVAGRFFASVVVLVGIGFVAMPSSIMTSALTEARKQLANETNN